MSVTKTGFCPDANQHGIPFPFLFSTGLPKHSVPPCHSSSSFEATAWQGDKGGNSSAPYLIPFLLFSSSPGPFFPLSGLQAEVWAWERFYYSSEISPPFSKPWLSMDTLCHLLHMPFVSTGAIRSGWVLGWGQGRCGGRKTPKPACPRWQLLSLLPLCWLVSLWSKRPCRPPLPPCSLGQKLANP